MAAEKEKTIIRILCRKLVIIKNEPGLQWLIGSSFFPQFTIASTFRCIHSLASDPLSPDYSKESDDLRMLLLKGFEVIGALIVGDNSDSEQSAVKAVNAARKLRKLDGDLIGAVSDSQTGNVRFIISRTGNSRVESVDDDGVVYEDQPEKYIWERGCMLLCQLPLKLPVYCSVDSPKETQEMYSRAIDAVAAQFKDPKATYIMETLQGLTAESPSPLIVRGVELNFAEPWNSSRSSENAEKAKEKDFTCSYFCSKSRDVSTLIFTVENADKIQVSVLLDRSEKTPKLAAPVAEYVPALKETKLLIVDFKLEVLCYAKKDLPLKQAVSTLIIPGLLDQLCTLKNSVEPNLSGKHPQLHPYHFCPPGVVHPVTVIHELSSRETEMKQVEFRRSLHLRLGLPLDRPLLRIVNAINLSASKDIVAMRKGSTLLKNVHLGVPSSGVSGGVVSLVQGSYEYYHYLQDGFDDSGWGCAYRSLQTIISWFRLQHYSSIDVPSHREIQQSLVDIEDKDPSFIGSREWIGAIELSFVLDKLLDVTCKVISVRSGAELPEKCRELALHFDTQGTPVMIGGGVLAYTLLGVDFDEASGDCAFLILDPHYTGGEDLKKIVNGGWCGWKKAVDSKGNHFFLQNKFYNLLLPQRPNMV